MSLLSRETTVINKLGLHARAASKLVNTASRFESEIWLEKDQRRINAKSIMGVLMLAAAKGSQLTVLAQGQDAETAINELLQLIADRFGEDE